MNRLEQIRRRTKSVTGYSWAEIQDGNDQRRLLKARRAVALAMVRACSMTGRDLGRFLNRSESWWANSRARAQKELERDSELGEWVDGLVREEGA